MPTTTIIPYVKSIWVDHIVDPTEFERDSNGDVITDPVTNQPKLKVIQEGTRFNAQRAMNIENGIYNAYVRILEAEQEMQRLRVQAEIDGRSPQNSGTFFDALDGSAPNKMVRQSTESYATAAVTAGATTISVYDESGFTVDTEITIYDDTASENVMITSVAPGELTVSTLTNNYKKGSKVARTNALIKGEEKEMTYSAWGTYSVTVSEVV
ncbi:MULTISPECIES: hypothetical protein [Pontibacillus]|uniref:Uncharacterized protein n=1 Tax=Pontibacillus chungwhensis TaxID=265426 RepID=A0ABY8UYK3_9BACI|nr:MULTISPECIES: hypothetical protein [Pontibacillus]MCD5324788.1 hypothetical protein [Pontibacillus sp. HN14]WIF98747.1 hypothetical protein QNI29_03590 [Pontibacillus chungwhensis]